MQQITRIKRAVEAAGYTMVQARRNGHWKIYDGKGRMLTVISCSPADSHAHGNMRSDLKRIGVII